MRETAGRGEIGGTDGIDETDGMDGTRTPPTMRLTTVTRQLTDEE